MKKILLLTLISTLFLTACSTVEPMVEEVVGAESMNDINAVVEWFEDAAELENIEDLVSEDVDLDEVVNNLADYFYNNYMDSLESEITE